MANSTPAAFALAQLIFPLCSETSIPKAIAFVTVIREPPYMVLHVEPFFSQSLSAPNGRILVELDPEPAMPGSNSPFW